MLYLVKHPYAAGIIMVLWTSSTVLFLIDRDLPIIEMVMTNMAASLLIAFLGLRTSSS